MQEFNISVELPDGRIEEVLVPEMITLDTLAYEFQEYYNDDIILALINGKLRELNKKVDREGSLKFVTVAQKDGRMTYRRSIMLLLQKVVKDVFDSESYLRVLYSLGQGYYCEIRPKSTDERYKDHLDNDGRYPVNGKILADIKARMKALVDMNLPIKKHSVKTEEAEKLFIQKGLRDKARLFHYRRSSRVNLYQLEGVEDYFYGFMAPSTGMLKYFDLEVYGNGFVITFPQDDTKSVEPLVTSGKLYNTLKNSKDWSKMLEIGSIGSLNDAIASGKGQDIILLQEALMEEQIGNIAKQVAEDTDKKFVMIAGPSSSGKTTFANRLSIQLTAKGRIPHLVSLDDYYADRELCPRNEDGTHNYECLEALDIEQFNEDMTKLLAGETVMMPTFNFKTGKREYRGNSLTLGKDDILVIEGIHGLNDKLSYSLPKESKFKIYISALTQLSVDEHNLLPTTDVRLLRRIVRDARTRNTTARETIAMWSSVRNGEENFIFPFQESADVMFNSALVYELSVLKVYAEPLLFQITPDCPEYLEAKRLLKCLDYFLPLPGEGIHKNSLEREFIGGSCFAV